MLKLNGSGNAESQGKNKYTTSNTMTAVNRWRHRVLSRRKSIQRTMMAKAHAAQMIDIATMATETWGTGASLANPPSRTVGRVRVSQTSASAPNRTFKPPTARSACFAAFDIVWVEHTTVADYLADGVPCLAHAASWHFHVRDADAPYPTSVTAGNIVVMAQRQSVVGPRPGPRVTVADIDFGPFAAAQCALWRARSG